MTSTSLSVNIGVY